MNRYIIIIIALFAIVSCNQKNGYKVTGSVENLNETKVLLERVSTASQTVIDTATIQQDGSFEMEGALENSALFQIRPEKSRGVIIYLEPGSEIDLNIDFESLENYSVSGNDESEEIKEFNEFLISRKNEKTALIEEFRTEADSSRKQEIVKQVQNYDSETSDLIKNKVENVESPLVGLIMIGSVNSNENRELFNNFANRLQLELPNSVYAKEFQSTVDKLNATKPPLSVGETAPEISMENPSGELLTLSSLKGNYVLLDFWAGWCGPCRKENPNVVNAYNKYKDEGFRVFNVSLDRNKTKWVQAIEQDNLDWPYHVSDLKYWNNAAALEYGVKSIPMNYLLNPEGEVIARNLRGPNLHTKLQEIFGES